MRERFQELARLQDVLSKFRRTGKDEALQGPVPVIDRLQVSEAQIDTLLTGANGRLLRLNEFVRVPELLRFLLIGEVHEKRESSNQYFTTELSIEGTAHVWISSEGIPRRRGFHYVFDEQTGQFKPSLLSLLTKQPWYTKLGVPEESEDAIRAGRPLQLYVGAQWNVHKALLMVTAASRAFPDSKAHVGYVSKATPSI